MHQIRKVGSKLVKKRGRKGEQPSEEAATEVPLVHSSSIAQQGRAERDEEAKGRGKLPVQEALASEDDDGTQVALLEVEGGCEERRRPPPGRLNRRLNRRRRCRSSCFRNAILAIIAAGLLLIGTVLM